MTSALYSGAIFVRTGEYLLKLRSDVFHMVGHGLEFDNSLLLEPDPEVCHARAHTLAKPFQGQARERKHAPWLFAAGVRVHTQARKIRTGTRRRMLAKQCHARGPNTHEHAPRLFVARVRVRIKA